VERAGAGAEDTTAPKTCTPNKQFCDGDKIYDCKGDGTPGTVSTVHDGKVYALTTQPKALWSVDPLTGDRTVVVQVARCSAPPGRLRRGPASRRESRRGRLGGQVVMTSGACATRLC
jgi:hypothetical protein